MNRRQILVSPSQSEICLFCLSKRLQQTPVKRFPPFLSRRNVSSTAIARGGQAEALAQQDEQSNRVQSPSGQYAWGQLAKRQKPPGLSALERAEIGIGADSSISRMSRHSRAASPDTSTYPRYRPNRAEHGTDFNNRNVEMMSHTPRRSISSPILDSAGQSTRLPSSQTPDSDYRAPLKDSDRTHRREDFSSRYRARESNEPAVATLRMEHESQPRFRPRDQMTHNPQGSRFRESHQSDQRREPRTDRSRIESFGHSSRRSLNPTDIRKEMGTRRGESFPDGVAPLRLQSDRFRADMPSGNRNTTFAPGQDPYAFRDRQHEIPRASNHRFVQLSNQGTKGKYQAERPREQNFIKYEKVDPLDEKSVKHEQGSSEVRGTKAMRTRAIEAHQSDRLERRKSDRPSMKGAFKEDRDRDSKSRKGRNIRKHSSMEEDGPDEEELNSIRQKKEQRKRARQVETPPTPIKLPPFISVANLASAMKIRAEEFVRKLEELGFEEIAMDHVLNSENAGLVAMEYNFSPVVDRSDIQDLRPRLAPDDKALLPTRPPIVTIMGHVDHGKTTLLDNLRKSSVVASEFGGITQHIGAFSVPMTSGKRITFLDTPGHAAFLSMRQRGANVTDTVVLVVAADDSVKPQTVEAISHAKAAEVPIIVAVNKVDKDGADVQRVKQDLLQHGIEVEDFGGDIQAVEVSGKTGQGLPDLEEAIVTLAELQDIRAEHDGAVEGWVLESSTDKAGRVATVLVRRGTLRTGDVIVAGTTWARVRTLHNEAGQEVASASPGIPIEVDGWRDQPNAGDEVLQASDEGKATDVVAFRQERDELLQSAIDVEAINEHRRIEADRRAREKEAATTRKTSQVQSGAVDGKDALHAKEQTTEEIHTTLNFIIKADVTGSAEAVAEALKAIPLSNFPSVSINIQRASNGAITETDIAHAVAIASSSPGGTESLTSAPDANSVQPKKSKHRHIPYIVAFNTDIPPQLLQAAHRSDVAVLSERIIYKVIDAARDMVEKYLPPVVQRRVLGEAETAQVFEIKGPVAGANSGGAKSKSKTTKVAGCRVRNGLVSKNAKVTVWRGGGVSEQQGAERVFDGTLASLKSHKKDVVEMRKGTECGMVFSGGWDGFRDGDFVQCYEEVQEKRKLPA